MSSFNFSTTPQKKYYYALSDGHIYKISSKKDDKVANDGGFFYCYFNFDPYCKTESDTYEPLYMKIAGNEYKRAYGGYYNEGTECGYMNTEGTFTSCSDKYYSQDGSNSERLPFSATLLPHVTKGNKTYYFDTMIQTGDNGKKSDTKAKPDSEKWWEFSRMNVGDSNPETYGDYLKELVLKNLDVYNWQYSVNNLPSYVKDSGWTFSGGISFDYLNEGEKYIFATVFKDKLKEILTDMSNNIMRNNNKTDGLELMVGEESDGNKREYIQILLTPADS